MKITVLVENNTKVKYYFRGESAFSLLIEEGDKKILFDAGYTDAYLRNALQMGLDLHNITHIVLSHGHLDHTWGIDALTKYITEAGLLQPEYNSIPSGRAVIIAHPNVFKSRHLLSPHYAEIGAIFTKEKLNDYFNIELSKRPVEIVPGKLYFLGEIPRRREFPFEGNIPVGKDEKDKDDYVEDDSSLVYKSRAGLVIITGCAHAGICNTIEYAKAVCGDNRIADVIGGLHLNSSPAGQTQLNGTVNYIRSISPPMMHACHCVDLGAKIALSQAAPLEEVYVGWTKQYT